MEFCENKVKESNERKCMEVYQAQENENSIKRSRIFEINFVRYAAIPVQQLYHKIGWNIAAKTSWIFLRFFIRLLVHLFYRQPMRMCCMHVVVVIVFVFVYHTQLAFGACGIFISRLFIISSYVLNGLFCFCFHSAWLRIRCYCDDDNNNAIDFVAMHARARTAHVYIDWFCSRGSFYVITHFIPHLSSVFCIIDWISARINRIRK